MTDNTQLQSKEESMQSEVQEELHELRSIMDTQQKIIATMGLEFKSRFEVIERRFSHHINSFDAHDEPIKRTD